MNVTKQQLSKGKPTMKKVIQASIASLFLMMSTSASFAQQEPSGVKYALEALEGAPEDESPLGLEVLYIDGDKITLKDRRVIRLKVLDQRRDISETDTL